MPEFLAPGVFVEEAESGARPIEGVSTSTAAFIGEAERGPLQQPAFVTSFAEYASHFGEEFAEDKYLPHAVRAFFQNGGSRVYVVRVASSDTVTDFEAALTALEAHRDISIVHAPGIGHTEGLAIQLAVVAHCEHNGRFAVLDSAKGQSPQTLDPRQTIDSAHAAFYAPWYVTRDTTAEPVLVPPGGAVCGLYASTDATRGVWKAPAGVNVRGAIDLEFDIDTGDQNILNPRGVNCLRKLPDGIKVWGARTLSSDPEWRYVNIRRYFLFLERSIQTGLGWAVFEPNDEPLWRNVKQTVTSFLHTQWRNGALLGEKPEDAFFVNVGRDTMTQNDIDNGRLIAQIGFAPVKPAEFVIVRIFQRTADAQD